MEVPMVKKKKPLADGSGYSKKMDFNVFQLGLDWSLSDFGSVFFRFLDWFLSDFGSVFLDSWIGFFRIWLWAFCFCFQPL